MQHLITREGLKGLMDELAGAGYHVLGPTVRDGAVVYDAIARRTIPGCRLRDASA